MKLNKKSHSIISVAGGKGGVGKSIFSIALGVKLAKEGHSVALVDLDLGAANLHTYLGIIKKTPTIADFILKKVPSLEDVLIDTSESNLKLISGAEFVPGMANPAHWMKMKITRHVKALPADFIIIDLGAGVHFNTLDFFGMSDKGIVVTAPEPGAVMNAYSFIKAALFRKLQSIFKKHPEIGPVIDEKTKNPEEEKKFSLEWLAEKVEVLAPDMLPLIKEIEKEFAPALVVNRIAAGKQHVLVDNLISLCAKRLGISMEHAGNLPDVPDIRNHLLNVPGFLGKYGGHQYFEAVQQIADKLIAPVTASVGKETLKTDYSDNDLDTIIEFMEQLDDNIFSGSNRNALKLKMYFKPSDVINFLLSRGVTHEAFYSQ